MSLFKKPILRRKTRKPKLVVNPEEKEALRRIKVPTLQERIENLKKDNEMLDRVRKKYNPDYVPYVPTTTLTLKTRSKKMPKTELEIYKEKMLSKKLKENTRYIQIDENKNNRRIINALARNYSGSIRDALEISELLSELNPAQVEGVLYYMEHKKIAVNKLKKKIIEIKSKNN
jgi:hypothetical protein